MTPGQVEAFGRYLVYEQLGMGGMARVNRAELTGVEGFNRQVALKRMLPHVASNKEMIAAFVREARLASHLRHANIAQTYDFGKVEDVYFIAMELVTGPTLAEILETCAQTTGPMPVQVALHILNQICDALDYAHNLCDETGQPLGIIHRDVSPSNVIVNEVGVVKLIDFGVAKASAAGMQTMSGMIKGKFGYMAPEYLLGDIDARADLFAIGVIAHELLTNRPLFSVADDMETMRRMRGMQIQPPSKKNASVPPEIDDIVMTALSRDPDGRWQQATALRTALTTLTKRLGLVCTNQQAVEWIAQLQLSARSQPPEEETQSDYVVDLRAASSSQGLTLLAKGLPEPPTPTPIGTPVEPLAAQPAPRSTTDIRTAQLRPSAPRIVLPPARPDPIEEHSSITDATELFPPDQSVTDATELFPPGHSITDVTEVHPDSSSVGEATEIQLPGLRTQPMGTPPGTPAPERDTTLLDGGAALRNRVAALRNRIQKSGLPPVETLKLRPPSMGPAPETLKLGPPSAPPAGTPQPRMPSAPPVAVSPQPRMPSAPPVSAAPQPRPSSAPPMGPSSQPRTSSTPPVGPSPQPLVPSGPSGPRQPSLLLPQPVVPLQQQPHGHSRPATSPPERRSALVIAPLVVLAAAIAAAGAYFILT